VLRGAALDDLKVSALVTPGMAVRVAPGSAFIGGFPWRLKEAVETVDVQAPSALDRVDLVQARLEGWTVGIKQGTESATPEAPTPDTDCIALAHLFLRPGMTSIKNADDTVNGYIADQRVFL